MTSPATANGSRQRIALLAGLLSALAGVIVVAVYLRRFEAEASGGGRVAVLAVSRDVVAGKPVTEELLAVRYVPAAYVDDRMILAKDRDRIAGIEAVIPLNAQNTLLWSDLAVRTDIRNLSQMVPPGKRAVTIQTNRNAEQQNMLLRPGDYVDVLASTNVPLAGDSVRTERATTILLQRVLVLAVGVTTERKAVAEGASNKHEDRVLTLSLEVDEAQLLALAMEQGTVSVIVRNPDDQRIQEALPDMPASSLVEARDRLRARKSRGRSDVRGPVKLVEAK